MTIEARSISKWYGSFPALRDVSLHVPAGRIVGLLGPNGAGKTTTIRIITGFFPPTSGSVSVCGYDTVDQSMAARRSIGYLPEAAPLYPEMSVGGYLNFRGRIMHLTRPERRRAIGAAMARARVADVARKRIGQLSKGYRQRVGLAAALLHDPPVLILDEPVSGLDPAQIRETRKLLRELAEKHTVLVSSHILPEVELTCDEVIIITRGRVRAQGTPRELVEGMGGDAGYVVEVSGAEGAERAIGAVEGVSAVRRERTGPDGWVRLVIEPRQGAPDLREPIARALVGAGVIARELHRTTPTLEHLFLRILEDEEAGAPAIRPAPTAGAAA